MKLPESLRPLCRRQAFELANADGREPSLDRLVSGLRRVLSEGLKELPVEAATMAPPVEETRIIGHDKEFATIVERAGTGGKLIVLTGRMGIGKSVTAQLLAKHQSVGDIIEIEARAEFTELTLIEAVAKRYPTELYADHEGYPFLLLKIAAQRKVAIDVLAAKKATLIIDGPGEAPHPRDADEEIALAREIAEDIASRDVLVVIASRHEQCWPGLDPIGLAGLAPADASQLLLREFRVHDPSLSANDLPQSVGGPDRFDELVKRGMPGELMNAAGRRYLLDRPNRRLGGVVDSIARVLSLFIGDPVIPNPKPSGERSAGLGQLFVVCLILMLAANACLIASYATGSKMWDRMFYGLPKTPDDVPELGTSRGLIGWGVLVEMARSAIVITGLLLLVVGTFFRRELAALIPYPPWAQVGPRRLTPRTLFRLFLIGLAIWMAGSIVSYHAHAAPRSLWLCRGNPFLQRYVEAGDTRMMEELRQKPDTDDRKMNGEPPGRNDPAYPEYWNECVLPYRIYFGYSCVMFVIVAPVVLTVCSYAIASSFWDHRVVQPREMASLRGHDIARRAINRLRHYKETYVDEMDRYLILLLVLVGSWAFDLWFDRYNLTEAAATYTTRMIVVALSFWAALFAALVVTYQSLVRETARHIPEGPMQDELHRQHGFFRFFLRAILVSPYSWLCVCAAATAGLWYVWAGVTGWHR